MQIATPLYNGQPIPFSLKPIEIPRQVYNQIENKLTLVLQEVEKFTTIALKDKKIMRQLGLPDALDATPTPLGMHIPFARFDFVLNDQNEPIILELNTDGTSGWNVVDWLCEQAKIKDHENPNLKLTQKLFEGLKKHKPEATDIHLIDFPDVMTLWEQEDLCQKWKIKKAEPEQRSWNEGSLIYRRAVSWQLREKALNTPFISDWNEKRITVVGGWSSDVGMSKAWPCFLNLKEVAETKFVDNTTERQMRAEKDLWVAKKKMNHSGRGVLRGCDADEKTWSEFLRNHSEIIVQKKVSLKVIENQRVEYGMFFINGQASGIMARSGHQGTITDTSSDLQRPVRIID